MNRRNFLSCAVAAALAPAATKVEPLLPVKPDIVQYIVDMGKVLNEMPVDNRMLIVPHEIHRLLVANGRQLGATRLRQQYFDKVTANEQT